MVGLALAHAIRVLAGFDKPHTQTTREEQDELIRHLRGAKTIVEIGVYEGATTILLANHADGDATIYGIDPFFPGRFGVCWSELVARHVTRRFRANRRVKFVKRYSHEAATEILGQVDFMFIDGDHSLEGIRRDWETWSPRIRPGGIIALHDSFPAPNSPGALGSQAYYRDIIAKDDRFDAFPGIHSLATLQRKA